MALLLVPFHSLLLAFPKSFLLVVYDGGAVMTGSLSVKDSVSSPEKWDGV